MKPLFAVFFALMSLSSAGARENLSLAGVWRFALDRGDRGVTERWFERALPDHVKLPGSLPAQGIGDPISTNTPWMGDVQHSTWYSAPEYAKYRRPGNVKVPFWLQPDTYYSGVAWYQRDFEIPRSWRGERVVLTLERPHWETSVWVDDRLVGTNTSLSTPHEYDLGSLAPGRHRLTIRVDNRLVVNLGVNSHCISDHTQGNWNGIVGRIGLCATTPVWIDQVQAYPNVAENSVRLKVWIGNDTAQPGHGTLRAGQQTLPVRWDAGGGTGELEVKLPEPARLWDADQPGLQRLTVRLTGGPADDEREVTFGLRQLATAGTQFTINGRKIFIRGTLECCVFPKTGHPPTDVQSWKRVIRVAKSYGLNLIRFHSWCPPEAAFEAADELGFYFQVETCWANQSTTLGDGKPVDQWVYAETDRILKYYGNHPSFILMPYGNEPGGKNAAAYLAKYVNHYRALDPRRLWTSGSGWPEIPENQFDITPEPRIQLWGAGLKSRINGRPPETTTDYHDYISKRRVPVISHEIGQWCVYPNFAEIPKYTGYLKPKNFEIFRDTLDAHGMGALAPQFLRASGRLQVLCYKEDIESALRTRGMGGFELLGLTDFPGQGTALVGPLDPFWDDKGYVTASAWRQFCNSAVPLARLTKRVFTTGENFQAAIEVAHFGPQPLRHTVTDWRLVDDTGRVVARGALPAQDIPVGNGVRLGAIQTSLGGVRAPARCRLMVRLAGTPFQNQWDVWVYPAHLPPEPAGILVTSKFDAEARQRLQAGGKVLLTVPGADVRNYQHDPVKLGFSSIFWNTAWTGRQAPTTLGILCDPHHPALAQFPTEFCSNWQWWYLIHRAGALRLDLLPQEVKPIVRVIDDWVTAHPLALVLEGRVGTGKIVICGFDLTGEAGDPVSRQMRASLLHYMAGRRFQPRVELTSAEIQSLFQNPGSASKP